MNNDVFACELKVCCKRLECISGSILYITPNNCGLRKEYLATLSFIEKNLPKNKRDKYGKSN